MKLRLVLILQIIFLMPAHVAYPSQKFVSSSPRQGLSGVGPFEQKECDDNEIIRRICGPGHEITPIVVDPTGIGLTLDDLKNAKRNGVPVGLRGEGFKKLEGVYKKNLATYKRLIQEFPEPYRTNFAKQLDDKVHLMTEEEARKYFSRKSEDDRADAMYDISDGTILYGLSYIDTPRISEASLGFILAHEIGHVTTTNKETLLPPAALSCFNRTYGKDADSESLADWLGSVIMNRHVQEYDNALDRLRYAQNSMKLFCNELSRERKKFRVREGLGHDSYYSERVDEHDTQRNRIIKSFRQPALRAAVGCTGKVIEQGKAVEACLLEIPTSSAHPETKSVGE